eukprot:TRINITY_DN33496_c0_g1_i1.p1 TRINITY_DN33496_c0_g1~~TRINITY_DN33496_c0_g1_i1.p1  ORF type:complete len:1544 (+),score=345.51 TRINITY_DN33496_c0_g1_i1:86-4717(+)
MEPVAKDALCCASASAATAPSASKHRARPGSHAEVSSSVRVVCRLRPMNEREKKAGTVPAATASNERRQVSVAKMTGGGLRQSRLTFNFDDVLTSFSTQEDVFRATLAPLIDEVLAGYEATCFAYGQTGTGKTYTMEGDLSSVESRGLVPRAASALFDVLSGEAFPEFSVTVSCLEIYNEELSDLLTSPQLHQKIELQDVGGGRGVCCNGLSEVCVSSVGELIDLVHQAQERRRVAETRINSRSSRSHIIFTMKVRCWRSVSGGEFENVGKLHLVDLAGSECAKKAGPQFNDDGFVPSRNGAGNANLEEERERRSINQSLLTLGRVIAALRDNSGRVPYRDSKLTRLLQDSLGGRCKTVIIATLSPALGAVDETISTLTYAEQASGIRNRPVATSLLRTNPRGGGGDATRPADPTVGASGFCSANDWAELEMKVVYLNQEVEEAQVALARKYREVQELLERTDLAEKVAQQSMAKFEHLAISHRRVRDICSEAVVDSEALVSSTKRVAEEATGALEETLEAHRDACKAAADVTREQELILEEVATEVARRDECFGRDLDSLAVGASDALVANHETATCFIGELVLTLRDADAAAAEGAVAAIAAKHGSDEVLGQRARALIESLNADSEALEALAHAAAKAAEEARRASCDMHTGVTNFLEETVVAPLVLLRGLIDDGEAAAGSHLVVLEAFATESSKGAEAASARRGTLLAATSAATAAHAAATAVRLPSVREELHGAITILDTHGAGAADLSASSRSKLSIARENLVEASESFRAETTAAISDGDTKLFAAWQAQRFDVENLSTVLEKISVDQRSANAMNAIETVVSEASADLAEALALSVSQLRKSRDEIARQVEELQSQRDHEQEIVALLAHQREVLEGDVVAIVEQLTRLKAELASARTEITNVRSGQELCRERVIKAVTAVLTNEMDQLRTDLNTGTADAILALDAAEDFAMQACGSAETAANRNDDLAKEVANEAGVWSEKVGTTCAAIDVAQELASEGESLVERGGGGASKAFEEVKSLALAWGRECDRLVDEVVFAGVSASALQKKQNELEPAWCTSRDRALAAVGALAEKTRNVDCTLDATVSDTIASAGEIEKLRVGLEEHHSACLKHVEAWADDADQHRVALLELADLGSRLAKEDDDVEQCLAISLRDTIMEATAMTGRASDVASKAQCVVDSVKAFASTLPEPFQHCNDALAADAAAAQSFGDRVGAVLRMAGGAVDGLQAAHLEATLEVSSCASAAARSVAVSVQKGAAAATSHSEASGVSIEQQRSQWDSVREHWKQAATLALTTTANARDKFAVAAEASAASCSSKLQRAVDVGRATSTAFARIVSDVASAAAVQQAALRRGAELASVSLQEQLGSSRADDGDESNAGPISGQSILLSADSEQAAATSLVLSERGNGARTDTDAVSGRSTSASDAASRREASISSRCSSDEPGVASAVAVSVVQAPVQTGGCSSGEKTAQVSPVARSSRLIRQKMPQTKENVSMIFVGAGQSKIRAPGVDVASGSGLMGRRPTAVRSASHEIKPTSC